MRSINFDDGLKSFAINGDESRVIRFNPGDPNIMLRAEKAQKRISQWQEELKVINLNPDGTPVNESDDASGVLSSFNTMLHDELNYIFNADVYDTVFAGQSPLCIVGSDKKFLFEAFLLPAIGLVGEEVEAFTKASEERIAKYTKEYHK